MFDQISSKDFSSCLPNRVGIVPVIKIGDPEKAVPLARSLLEGRIPCAEITFRTDAAEESIRWIKREIPQIILGAGTVLTTEQADRAIDAGAVFLVSPGFNPRVVEHALRRETPIIPGCCTPSEMEMAIEIGLSVVKFFPAEQAGGVEFIKAVSAVYSTLSFMPTGGINAQNLARYLALKNVLACGGSWMAPPDLIEKGDFSRITALSLEAAQIAADAIAARKG
jgi:2-dehydro-3-deoxyphosphogluconate aldolase/(4S)-4-hydroxy-2-oxoglutarate aldolase